MARLPRLAVAGQPHFVVQPAHASTPAFLDDTDRRAYSQALAEAARTCRVALHAYVLLDDQVALLVTPQEVDALGRCMQRVGRRYVPAFNQRHQREGPLWAGRFGAAVVDPQSHLLAAIRLIEQAPVRAGLVADPCDWPWSSAAHHTGRCPDALITEHPQYWRLGNTPFEREARHALALQQPLRETEIEELLRAARGGRVVGSAAFAAAVTKASGRPSQPRARGRPRIGSGDSQ